MNMPAIDLIAAQPSDAEALVAVRLEAMRESLERIGRFNPERARERFLSGFIPAHTQHIVVAGERAGFVVVKPADDALLLDHLYIRPACQRRGIGAAVLASVFADADARSLPVRVGALVGSESNRFYQRHGFELVEQAEWDNYYVRPAAAKAAFPSRIVVVGMSGSGKSTVARQLAASAGAPHIELDGLFWGPGWEPRPPHAFRGDVERAVAAPRWIVDGNYSTVRDIVWPRAEMVVWLNLPFGTTLWQVLGRTNRRWIEGTTLWNGNRESLRRSFFSRESILWWVIRNHGAKRRHFEEVRASGRYPHLQWVELNRPEQFAEFIERVSSACGS
jgi:adenylate kinase family enzyme/ribosomal protein S18 acetylase RimI-like enzyme